MTQDEGKRECRHPDAVAYPDGLGEEGAAMVRPYGGGHVRYWIKGGEVRDLDVAEDSPPEALPAAVSAEFGPVLPRLAAITYTHLTPRAPLPAVPFRSIPARICMAAAAWNGNPVASVRETRPSRGQILPVLCESCRIFRLYCTECGYPPGDPAHGDGI